MKNNQENTATNMINDTNTTTSPTGSLSKPETSSSSGQGGGMRFSKILYFDHSLNRFWMKMPNGFWVKLDRNDAFSHVAYWVGDADTAHYILIAAQQNNSVNFAGSLGGYSEGLVVNGDVRMLVTSSPKFIIPKPGNWDMLRRLLEGMFGADQLPYLYGWIKVALEMFAAQKWMAGQALILCGEAESGKNLLAFLLQHLFGGRAPGKPFSYMTQKSDFNSDFVGCELLTVEDEVSHAGIQERRAFGAKIKDLAVNESRRLHKKHAEALTVAPMQRLVISLNDEPNSMLVLPPIESDNADKIMLLKVFKRNMLMPTNTAKAREAYGDALVAQLPGFVDYLQNWQIPTELVANRYGIKHYHHPDLLGELNQFSPEGQLLRLIDEVLFTPYEKVWHGKASELDRKLKSSSSEHVRREAAKLLQAGNSCGRYLSNLATRHPDRVTKHAGRSGIRKWTITAPESCEDDEDAPQCLPSKRPNVSQELLAKIRATAAAKSEVPATVGEDESVNQVSAPENASEASSPVNSTAIAPSKDSQEPTLAINPSPQVPEDGEDAPQATYYPDLMTRVQNAARRMAGAAKELERWCRHDP